MELLKQRIMQDGRCYPGGILKWYCSGYYGGIYFAVAGCLCQEKETEDHGKHVDNRCPFFHERP